jgi:hypothetical protein
MAADEREVARFRHGQVDTRAERLISGSRCVAASELRAEFTRRCESYFRWHVDIR